MVDNSSTKKMNFKATQIIGSLLIVFLSINAMQSFAQNAPSFVFQGNIKGYGNGEIIMTYSNPNERVKPDTIPVKNDIFILKGKLEAPMFAFTKIMNNGKLTRDFFRFDFMLENSTIKFNAEVNNLDKYILTGSANNDLMIRIRDGSRELIQDFLKVEKEFKAAEEDSKEQEQIGLVMEKKQEAYLNYLLNYKGFYNNYAGTYLLWLFSPKRIPWQSLDTLIPHFDESVRNSTYFEHMQKTVDAAKRILPGGMAADFVVKDLDGKEYSLKNFRGHYLLMTFSASWCVPCKYEYPFLEKAYAKYADKGLKMIIMNVDETREKWAGDVKKYNFPFPMLSDLKAFTGDLTKNYGALSIPKVFLIDPEGKIVSGTIRQQGILDLLEEVYN